MIMAAMVIFDISLDNFANATTSQSMRNDQYVDSRLQHDSTMWLLLLRRSDRSKSYSDGKSLKFSLQIIALLFPDEDDAFHPVDK